MSMVDRSRDILEHLPCGYLRMTARGVIITDVNEAFARLTGFARSHIAGKRLSDLFTVGCRIHFETHFAPLLEMQGFVEQVALDLRHESGRSVPVLLNAVLHRDETGAPREIHAAVVDVSERKTYEKELLLAREKAERAAQARADFVSMFSHEIRTSLNAIVGVSQLLTLEGFSPSQARFLGILKDSAHKLLDLVNDILDFSKIEAGKVTLEQRPLDVRKVVSGVVDPFRPKTAEKHVDLVTTIGEDVPCTVVGDPVKLGQMLTNLVSNAAKFTSTGFIEVRVEKLASKAGDRCHLRFSVQDTGIGIAPERMSAIFEDYTQAGYEISEGYGGTGLGLAIVKRLAELHGTPIEVTSTVGKGSTFSFSLSMPYGPLALPDEKKGPVEPLRGLRALVLDDSDVNLLVMEDLLKQWAMTVDVTTSGRDALAKAKAAPYDVILVDLHVPDMDGQSVARAIRAMGPPLSAVPIIAVSGAMRMGSKESFLAAGFTDFVGKPIRPDALSISIRKHTGR